VSVQPRIVTSCLTRDDGQPSPSYEILKEIGAGNMAKVYLGRKVGSAELVAIKVPDAQMHKDLFERFCREGEMMQKFDHPNVVHFIDFVYDEQNRSYLVMEYLEGARTLADVINDYKGRFFDPNDMSKRVQGSLVPSYEALDYFRQILAGLGAIHDAGIIHRDLKPENIMVTVKDGKKVLKIMDFGIGKDPSLKTDKPNLTQDMIIGTPYYFSPEHISAQRHSETEKNWLIGTYSDIWAAFVILYEMMSGQLPFTDEKVQVLVRLILETEPKPITDYVDDVDPAILQLFAIGLNKKPWKRPQSVKTMLELLDRDPALVRISKRPTMINVPGVKYPASQKAGRTRRMRLLILGGAVLIGGSVITIGLLRPTASPSPRVGTVVAEKPVLSAPRPTVVVPVQAVQAKAAPAPQPSAAKAVLRKPGAGPTEKDGSTYRAFTRGMGAAAVGNCRTAEMEMNFVLIRSPDFPTPYRILGDCARKRGKATEARGFYRQYLSYDGVEPLSTDVMSFVTSAK